MSETGEADGAMRRSRRRADAGSAPHGAAGPAGRICRATTRGTVSCSEVTPESASRATTISSSPTIPSRGHHCELLRAPDGIHVRDLESTNGTRVDGTRIREAVLGSGHVLEGGRGRDSIRPTQQRMEVLPSDKTSFGSALGQSLAMRTIFGVLRADRADGRDGAPRGRDRHRQGRARARDLHSRARGRRGRSSSSTAAP